MFGVSPVLADMKNVTEILSLKIYLIVGGRFCIVAIFLYCFTIVLSTRINKKSRRCCVSFPFNILGSTNDIKWEFPTDFFQS